MTSAKSILILLLLTGSMAAFAGDLTEKVECQFTEPFFGLILKPQESELYKKYWSEEKNDIVVDKIADVERIEIFTKDPFLPKVKVFFTNGESLTLIFDNQGPVGESDSISPISAIYTDKQGTWKGGCFTDKLPTRSSDDGDVIDEP